MPARMRWDGAWLPASIRNISRHGVELDIPNPPRAGTYVELQIGKATLAARMIWTASPACGLRLGEALDLSTLNASGGTIGIKSVTRPASARLQAQPVQRSHAEQHEHSRRMASLIQYVTFVVIILSAATGLGWEVYQTLSSPVLALDTAFKPQLTANP